jgi:chromate transporter
MEPELYFFERWLRQRHADLRATARSAWLTRQPDGGARDAHSSQAKEMDMASMKRSNAVQNWKDIALAFIKLGATSYGGPAIMGIMQAELQQKRQWVSKERFVEGLSVVNMLPGATAVQLGIFLGYARGGWWGGLLGGLCFVLPAFGVMLLLTIAYASFGVSPIARGALYGLGPVVLAIFTVAVYRLGRSAAATVPQAVIAVLAAAATIATPLGIAAILALAGGAGLLLFHSRKPRVILAVLSVVLFAVISAIGWSPSVSGFTISRGIPNAESLVDLGAYFFKVGAFTVGGGLTMIAFMQDQVVGQFHWLTPREFIDGLALGQFTPGPLLMVAAYVGYKVAGIAGATVAATATFLPSFILMLAILPVLERVRQLAWTRALMRGMGPAVIGVLAVSLLKLAPYALPDLFAIVISVATLAALLIWQVGAFKLILSGSVLGVLRSQVSWVPRVKAAAGRLIVWSNV